MIKRYFEDIWTGIYSTLVGMGVTWSHLFTKKVTMQYPELYNPNTDPARPDFIRNRLFVDMDLCIGCMICQRNCPVNCISIETIKAVKDDPQAVKPNGNKINLWVNKFDIDFSKCMFCNLCTEECPTNAINMTKEFEYSEYHRRDLLYHFSVMNNDQISEKKKMLEEEKAKKAAAAKAAADKPEGK